MYYLGIDGGGTKTAFALMNDYGEIISSYEAAGCYYAVVGKDGLLRVLREGMAHCLKDIDPAVVAACAGIPAYGELSSLMRDLEEIGPKLSVPTRFTNDVEIGYAGALGFDAGINIVSGTGSIAIGFDEAGGSARSGGFGHEMNCDEGSAHWIGLSLLQKFTRQSDLREERTLLYGALRKEIGIASDFDIMTYAIEEIKMARDEIAKLSIFAALLANDGDPVCIRLFEDAARELSFLAFAVDRQLRYEQKPINVSYSGGVFKSGDLVLEPLRKYLAVQQMSLVKPLNTPVYGACITAQKRAKEIVENAV